MKKTKNGPVSSSPRPLDKKITDTFYFGLFSLLQALGTCLGAKKNLHEKRALKCT